MGTRTRCLYQTLPAHRCYAVSWVPGRLQPFLGLNQPQQSESDVLSRQGSRASLLSHEGSTASQMLQGRPVSSRAVDKAPKRSKRPTPGFQRQFAWCLSRVALQRTREPLIVVTDYAIFALTGTPVSISCKQATFDAGHINTKPASCASTLLTTAAKKCSRQTR